MEILLILYIGAGLGILGSLYWMKRVSGSRMQGSSQRFPKRKMSVSSDRFRRF